MQISPRYDAEPIVRLDGTPSAVGPAMLRQRRRFADQLARLSREQWETPSRCEGWRVQDVVAHLTGTDQFWNLSIQSGLAGSPTRYLASFDPKATPATLVDGMRGADPAAALAAFLEADQALCATVEGLDDAAWTAIGEAPVGHITISGVVHHALWDAWVHERDVLEPLGLHQEVHADEVEACLRYAAALAPAFSLQTSAVTGALALDLHDPDLTVLVTVADDCVSVTTADAPAGALVLRGPALDVLEALSVRAPWRQPIPPDQAWLVAGLAEVFESTPAP